MMGRAETYSNAPLNEDELGGVAFEYYSSAQDSSSFSRMSEFLFLNSAPAMADWIEVGFRIFPPIVFR